MSELFRRRQVPHWDKPNAIYFITACLADSIPARGLLDLKRFRNRGQFKGTSSSTKAEVEKRIWKQSCARADQWLDKCPTNKCLQDPRLAAQVQSSLLHFAGERYALWAYVVMPSHFHWVLEPNPQWVSSLGQESHNRTPRERIMHSVKRHSARMCNKLLNRTGKFWQEESYDHCVEDVDELERIVHYVEDNPVKAQHVNQSIEWKFSSARYREQSVLAWGAPVIGKTMI